MKRILCGIYMFVVALSVWAVPARPSFFKVTQPDGSELVVRAFGDEYFHGLMTQDGTVVTYDAETGWYRPEDATTLEAQMKCALEKRQQINQLRMERLASAQRAPMAKHEIGERCPREGDKHGLVILVNFKNKQMVTPHKTFDDMFNKKGYSGNGHIGSVSDYFSDQSYGKLNIEFDVVGPVTVKNNYSYYGKNVGGQGNDDKPEEMIVEACKMINDSVDFSKYDWDGDGEVDQVYVIYAGYGENYGADSNTIWPHEYHLSYSQYYGGASVGAQTLDGVRIDTYACSAELAYTSGSTPNGIGTACHEFSHCLGFPDMYDTDYSGAASPGDWDLMDAGSYSGPNGLGEVPCGMSAYERWMGGWLELTELTDPCVVSNMPNLGDSACAYIIYNEAEHYEAYLLENRQNKRWYSYPSNAHGLLITHVDYNAQAWYGNSVNDDPSHPRLTIVPANNSHASDDASLRGQTWPGTKGKTALTNSTTPAATTYNKNSDGKKFLNAPIEGITEKAGLIGFSFKGGVKVDAPELALTADDYCMSLSWEPVEGATSYEVKVASWKHDEAGAYLLESMDNFVVEKDATKDISASLDHYTALPGWYGVRIYQGVYGLKIGTSTSQGTLRTPMLEANGTVLVKAELVPYGSDDNSVTISLLSDQKQVVASQVVNADGSVQEIELEGATGQCYVQIKPKKRAYVASIEISNNATKQEDFYQVLGNATSFAMYDQEFDTDYDYSFQVRSVCGSYKSEWSKVVIHSFHESNNTGIETLQAVKSNNATRYDLFGRPIKMGNNKFQIINNQLIYQKQ